MQEGQKDLKKPFVRKCPGGCLKNNQPGVFENIHSFHNHLNTKHFKLECPLCDEEFHTMSSQEMHMAKKHLVCERCSGNCTSFSLMSYFLIFCHIGYVHEQVFYTPLCVQTYKITLYSDVLSHSATTAICYCYLKDILVHINIFKLYL